MVDNFFLSTDAYKLTHHAQYPPGTQHIHSYLEARGDGTEDVVFFGLQGLLSAIEGEYLWYSGNLLEAWDKSQHVFGHDYFNLRGWHRLLGEHEGGLPIEVRAVPEGTVVPTGNVLMTVENTDPLAPWLTNWIETRLMQVWYPTTVSTRSWRIKRLIGHYAKMCGSVVTPFHLNDFGFRGVSSMQSAAIGGAAHLVHFQGTDNLAGIEWLQEHYGADHPGQSVMATEHSTTTSWGGPDREFAFLEHLLEIAPPDAIVSVVADSYDFERFVSEYIGTRLKERILARPGQVVVRPDSGNPPTMALKACEILWEKFGGRENKRGYKVLDPHVGVIYGDGINEESIRHILELVTYTNGFSTDGIVFGMGGALLQDVTRDTHSFAFKASAIQVNGEWRDVWKRPATDPAKNSKRGRLALVQQPGGHLTTLRMDSLNQLPSDLKDAADLLRPVYRNGEILVRDTLKDIQGRVA